ncbi:AbrB/MazE/SpoVT family DNA-binding domain-containing protein [Deinococcus aestuarii]|uniref:AbrB/MazE/SpoVT family DNA-binding domain-containing protein n=1 Tax=Deinococcus aestuarii TaxID=2774531 RepID=UPI001FE67B8E|nr:AbrB/MazE/SpoVT family DNA-binding domain-containing protein [Deinococcus aestuarii]
MGRTVLTSKGQVTIPANVREALGLGAGDQLLIELQEGGFSAKVVKKTRVSELRGMFAGPPLPEKEELRESIGRELGEELERSP